MTTRRAVTYGGLFCLLAAWLASAASTTLQDEQQAIGSADGPALTSTEALANEVQAHAAKLRDRLSTAPVPQAPHRNPFLFEARALPPPRPPMRRLEPAPIVQPALADPEPALALIGVAEDQGPQGLTRTAILAGDAESVFMVTVGETVLGRYRVEAISADVVELKDVRNETTRRLALR